MIEIVPGLLVLIAAAVIAGAMVQSVVGIGVGLIAAPPIALLAPELMPGTLLVLGLAMPVLTLLRERSDVDWHGVAWALPGRLLGTAAGVWVVSAVSARALGVAVGCVVLVAALITVRSITVPVTRTSLNVAGFTSGVVGTTSAVGGPPMALLYQHRPASEIRSTMAVFFLVGTSLSVVSLAASGHLPAAQMLVGLALFPALLLGELGGRRLRGRVPPGRVRAAVLATCAASSIVLIARSLW
ncbi:sulfite exporter TauE/SafE family protein [Aeromicrobium sp.]|uniref:sulfite exporter TauE/SafE family protein n=1 Tax=Aeromicrobium sp. TaxID=1871063 RepID=UPI0028A7F08D|nr:sulfite exporter TauE/SafE family protein [Aeromicrobium sp.]